MSKLDELLQGVDVEWKKLWEVTTWDKKFNSVEKHKQPKTNKYKYLLASEIKPLILEKGTIKLLSTNDTNWWTSEELVGNNFHEGEIIAIPWGGNPIVQYYKGKFLTGDNRIAVVNDPEYLSTKFLHYYLTNNINLISSFYRGAGIKHPNMHNVLELDIPIPPIEIQQEIVRVLDELTSLTNQLKTELETERQNRKKQFEFFREQLFTFEEGSIIFNKLGEIGEFQRGKRFVKTDMISEGVPCIHYGEMYTHYGIWANKTKSFLSKELVDSKKLRLAKKNDVIMVAAGETIEDIGKGTSWLSDQGVVFHDACFSYTSPLNPSYVAYFTRTKQFHDQIRRNISSGKISAINSKGLEKVYIPIPSLAEQERIVKLLDQFDSTHTAIEEEITKEIKLRTQQYEYYREKLLSFPQN